MEKGPMEGELLEEPRKPSAEQPPTEVPGDERDGPCRPERARPARTSAQESLCRRREHREAGETAARTTDGGGAAVAARRRQQWNPGWTERGRRGDTGSGRDGGGAGWRWEIKAAVAASLPPSRTWSLWVLASCSVLRRPSLRRVSVDGDEACSLCGSSPDGGLVELCAITSYQLESSAQLHQRVLVDLLTPTTPPEFRVEGSFPRRCCCAVVAAGATGSEGEEGAEEVMVEGGGRWTRAEGSFPWRCCRVVVVPAL